MQWNQLAPICGTHSYALYHIGFEEAEASLPRDAQQRKCEEAEKQIAEGVRNLEESTEEDGASAPVN